MDFEFDFAMCHHDFNCVVVPYHEYPYPICI